MAIVMKQQNRAEEAIEAIKSLRVRCSDQAQESLDNILLDLYKRCGRLDDQIGLLKHKLFLIQQGMSFNGKRTKTARSQGKKFQVSVEQEGTRPLGNLGWALMHKENYTEAEDAYRRALCIAPDNNKMCNLGICLMKQGRIREAKDTLRRVKPAVVDGPRGVDSHLKAYERSQQMLRDLESEMMIRGGDDKVEQRRLFDAIFGSSSIWQPQHCTAAEPKVAPLWQPHPSKSVPSRSDDCYGDENANVNVIGNSGRALFPPLHRIAKPFELSKDQNGDVINSLNVDAQPFIFSEKLKRTRSSGTNAASPVARRRLSLEKTATDSGLPDNKDFEEAILAAVLGTQTKTSQRL